MQLVQINPSRLQPERKNTEKFLAYKDARRVIKIATDAIPWISHVPITSDQYARHGQFFPLTGDSMTSDTPARLQAVLNDMPVAVVAGDPSVESFTTPWRSALEQSGAIRIVDESHASALVVVIPDNSSEKLLQRVYNRFRDFPGAWKVVGPDPANKDWNVLFGIATRFGNILDPVIPLRERDPGTKFLGIDIGHSDKSGSTVAASLVDSQGRLLAWTSGPNTNHKKNSKAEMISEGAIRSIGETLLACGNTNAECQTTRLVIHRDGDTIENMDKIINILDIEFGIRNLDWMDVNKSRAPIFFLGQDKPTGQFVVYEDNRGQQEMWVRTAKGKYGRYTRPLCLVPRTCNSDIETLGLEIFDLSNAASQDYQANTKLPVTTYFADGFSSTGSKQVKFWGYEQLKKPWH